MKKNIIKLNIGCGDNLLDDYTNIDAFKKGKGITNIDILNANYKENSVDEILCEHVVEHIPFKNEKIFWLEIYRILKPKAKAIIEVPDLEWICKQFLDAKDEFDDFYKVGSKDHYFGNGKSIEHRWGILTTAFFGNQNGNGQFHYNGYTKQKLIDIHKLIGFTSCKVIKILNKGTQCLVANYTK